MYPKQPNIMSGHRLTLHEFIDGNRGWVSSGNIVECSHPWSLGGMFNSEKHAIEHAKIMLLLVTGHVTAPPQTPHPLSLDSLLRKLSTIRSAS